MGRAVALYPDVITLPSHTTARAPGGRPGCAATPPSTRPRRRRGRPARPALDHVTEVVDTAEIATDVHWQLWVALLDAEWDRRPVHPCWGPGVLFTRFIHTVWIEHRPVRQPRERPQPMNASTMWIRPAGQVTSLGAHPRAFCLVMDHCCDRRTPLADWEGVLGFDRGIPAGGYATVAPSCSLPLPRAAVAVPAALRSTADGMHVAPNRNAGTNVPPACGFGPGHVAGRSLTMRPGPSGLR
jgi:hypothetical protein